MDEAIQYPIASHRTGAPVPGDPGRPDLRQRRRALRAQPPTACRADLEVGDRLEIGATGAYTTTYAAVGFNGFDPLAEHYV